MPKALKEREIMGISISKVQLTYVEKLDKKLEELKARGVTNINFSSYSAYNGSPLDAEELAEGALKHLEAMDNAGKRTVDTLGL